MKKLLWTMLIAALCFTGVSAMAESGRIDDLLFNNAKQTLYCMDTGDYKTASALLGCMDMAEIQALKAQFATLGGGTAQTRISVAFYCNQQWNLAVPTAEPSSAEIEALLLNCGSGMEFASAQHAVWGDVQTMLDGSEAVIWNEEYAPDVFVIMD